MQILQINSFLQGGKYRIEKVLGQGGFGITYLATQELLERKVCIKEFFFKNSCSRTVTGEVVLGTDGNNELAERFLNKFIKEARTISKLEHPNIIRILDVFKKNGTVYYVMNYVDGQSLDDIVKQRGALLECEAIEYITQIASALDYLHQHKINHLDVKPANIMIRKDDNKAILIDFGISKQYDEKGEQTSTTPVGLSYGFAPIEQYKPGGVSSFSPSTDIYSLGATLYKLITGNTPPQAIDLLNEELPDISNVSSNIASAITKSMQIKSDNRPKSISEFLDILEPKFEKLIDEEITKIITSDNCVNSINGHEYVNLGLSVKWSKMNIGATESDYRGAYFSYGELEKKSKYTSANSLILGKTIDEISGSLQYDAARVQWGGTWRLPTKEEIEELNNKCVWKWEIYNNSKGYRVTAPNGNSIFFPALGYIDGDSCAYDKVDGYYWSATPEENDAQYAYGLKFYDGFIGIRLLNREYGISIRPVSD